MSHVMANFGPAVPQDHKTSHQNGGSDEIDVTGLTGLTAFIHRGDPAASDKQSSDFTKDNTWRDLDLSAVVPEGAQAIAIVISAQSTSASAVFALRYKGNSNAVNVAELYCSVANGNFAGEYIIACPSTRIIQYKASNHKWTYLWLTVHGWIK